MKLSISQIKNVVAKNYPKLSEQEFDILLSISKYRICKNKEIILKKGRRDKTVFIILKGAARAYSISEGGIEQNSHLRAEGFLFGDPKVFSNETQILDIEAIGEIHILEFDIDELETLGFDYPEIMKFYLSILKEIIAVFSQRINTFVTMNSEERYFDLIKWNPMYLKNTFDKHLASFLGVTPLTFYRIKKKQNLSNDVF